MTTQDKTIQDDTWHDNIGQQKTRQYNPIQDMTRQDNTNKHKYIEQSKTIQY